MSDRELATIVRHQPSAAANLSGPAAAYIALDFAEQQIAKIGMQVWQMMSRTEDILEIGNFQTDDSLGESLWGRS